jgi:hypothetical protein
MEESVPSLETLLELEARHDDLLVRLEELDRRVVQVLAECQVTRPPVEPATR